MSAAKFQPGDKVTMVNDFGIAFPGKTIVKRDNAWTGSSKEPRYFITPTDTPWFSFPESSLRE